MNQRLSKLRDRSGPGQERVPRRTLPGRLARGIDMDEGTKYLWESGAKICCFGCLELFEEFISTPGDRASQPAHSPIRIEGEPVLGGGAPIQFLQAERHEREGLPALAAGVRQHLVSQALPKVESSSLARPSDHIRE